MKTHTFLEHLFQLTRIPIRIYSLDGIKQEEFQVIKGSISPFEEGQIQDVLKKIREKDFVFSQYEDLPAALAGCRGKEQIVLLGPAAIGKTDSKRAEAAMKKYSLQVLPNIQIRDLLLAAVLVLNEISEGEYTLKMLQEEMEGGPQYALENVLAEELRQYDSFQKNHTYVEEQAFFEHIKNGDTEYITRNYEKITPPHPVVVKNLHKNEEYMAVIEISLAARSAIQGGMTSREGLLMNDIYLEQLARCQKVDQILKLKKEACLHFAQAVKERKKTEVGNPYVEDCKKDIQSRKREKIDLQKIADDVGISKEYMMKLFKKHEGIPVTDYIIQVKLEAACNMLKFSDRKIGEISDYLSFGSLNYFCRIFVKRMGMSPGEYRRTHHQPNF